MNGVTLPPGFVVDVLEEAKASRRLNIGCGHFPLLYWTNLDADPRVPADLHCTVPPLPYPDASLDEIYAGHALEHLTPADARALLVECHRCLVPGGRIGVVVPDTREIFARYLRGDDTAFEVPAGQWRHVTDLDALCDVFIFSTCQDSPHEWMYDETTLRRRITEAGFTVTGEIDRFEDARIPVGAWYQFGLEAVKP